MYNLLMMTQPNIGSPSSFQQALSGGRRKDPWASLSFDRNNQLEEPEVPEEDGIISALTALRNRQNPALSEYQKYLEEGVPRENNRGNFAKISAALLSGLGAGFGDANAPTRVQQAYDAPYEREVRDYENRGKTLAARVGIENSRYKQELDSINAIREYEQDLDKRNLDRAKFGLDVSKFGVDKKNTESLIENRPLSTGVNDVTGQWEVRNQLTGARNPFGQVQPSFAEKFVADEQHAVNADNRITKRQAEGDRRAFDYSSRLKGIRSADSLASDGMRHPSSSEQTDAEQAVDKELVTDPRFLGTLFEATDKGYVLKSRPEPRAAGIFRGGNEADVKAYDDAKAIYDAERAKKVRDRLGLTIGRFEIIR